VISRRAALVGGIEATSVSAVDVDDVAAGAGAEEFAVVFVAILAFASPAGFFGGNRYDQPKSTSIDKAAAIKNLV